MRVQLRQQALRVCAPAARSRAPVRQNSLRSPVCTSESFRGLQNKLGPGSLTGLLDGLSLVLAIRREVCAHAREIVSQPARKQCEGTLLTKVERDDVEGWGYGLPCAGAKEVLRGCCALRCVLTTPTSVVTKKRARSAKVKGGSERAESILVWAPGTGRRGPRSWRRCNRGARRSPSTTARTRSQRCTAGPEPSPQSASLA